MYNRLFTKILDSSIWLEPDSTRIVWFTFLAAMNEDGFAHFSALENLAARARVSLAKAKRAIEVLEGPDPNSENPDNDGRRLERVPGGWMVLNAGQYREKFSREIEREQTRLRVAKHRAKESGNKPTVTKTLQSVSPASVSESSSDSVSKRKPKDLPEVVSYAKTREISAFDAEAFYDSQESGGWTRGGKALRDWKAALRTWKSNGWLASQKQRKNGAHPDAHKPIDKSKIDVPERFKSWVSERYPARREDAMKWRTWADVPRNGLRDEWWKEEKTQLPIDV